LTDMQICRIFCNHTHNTIDFVPHTVQFVCLV
jgi:hypothetical protein